MSELFIKNELDEYQEQFSEHENNDDDYILPTAENDKGKGKKNKNANKPRVIAKWSDDDIFKLITCVRENPALWDPHDSLYRNKNERAKLWDQISEYDFKSKFPRNELLAKWSNIRIQYRSYANKKNKSGDDHRIIWKFFSAVQFIRNVECEHTGVNESNMILTEDTENSTSSISKITTPNGFLASQYTRKRRRSTSTAESSSPPVGPIQPTATTFVEEAMIPAVETTLNPTKQHTCLCGNMKPAVDQSNDEFEMFGKFLASELRSLDDIGMARRIKRKVNRYFLDAIDEEQKIQ